MPSAASQPRQRPVGRFHVRPWICGLLVGRRKTHVQLDALPVFSFGTPYLPLGVFQFNGCHEGSFELSENSKGVGARTSLARRDRCCLSLLLKWDHGRKPEAQLPDVWQCQLIAESTRSPKGLRPKAPPAAGAEAWRPEGGGPRSKEPF